MKVAVCVIGSVYSASFRVKGSNGTCSLFRRFSVLLNLSCYEDKCCSKEPLKHVLI